MGGFAREEREWDGLVHKEILTKTIKGCKNQKNDLAKRLVFDDHKLNFLDSLF
jgi:hypothetical protein